MRSAIFVVGLLMAAPAMAADQFDLICKGQYQERPGGRSRSTEAHYRIDLATKNWCQGRCDSVKTIQSIETGKLELEPYSRNELAGTLSYHEIDRVSGKYQNYTNGDGLYWNETGNCDLAAFSGFPAAKF